MSEFSDLKSLLQQVVCRVENGPRLSKSQRIELWYIVESFKSAVARLHERRVGDGDRRAPRSFVQDAIDAALKKLTKKAGERRKAPRRVGEDRRTPGVGTPEIGRRMSPSPLRRRIPDRRASKAPNS